MKAVWLCMWVLATATRLSLLDCSPSDEDLLSCEEWCEAGWDTHCARCRQQEQLPVLPGPHDELLAAMGALHQQLAELVDSLPDEAAIIGLSEPPDIPGRHVDTTVYSEPAEWDTSQSIIQITQPEAFTTFTLGSKARFSWHASCVPKNVAPDLDIIQARRLRNAEEANQPWREFDMQGTRHWHSPHTTMDYSTVPAPDCEEASVHMWGVWAVKFDSNGTGGSGIGPGVYLFRIELKLPDGLELWDARDLRFRIVEPSWLVRTTVDASQKALALLVEAIEHVERGDIVSAARSLAKSLGTAQCRSHEIFSTLFALSNTLLSHLFASGTQTNLCA